MKGQVDGVGSECNLRYIVAAKGGTTVQGERPWMIPWSPRDEKGAFVMCTTTTTTEAFDPQACPLLRGLSPAEMERKIQKDARIQACLASLGEDTAIADPNIARLIATYRSRAPHRSAGAPLQLAIAACAAQ